MFVSTVISIFTLTPYYYDRRIHNLGNAGFQGRIHAEAAYVSTKIIDRIRYNGRDIRKEIIEDYKNNTVLDLCCGIGLSTMENGEGIDTSYEMLRVALRTKFKENSNKEFSFGNAETYKPEILPDIVTCMFAFHEMPLYAQCRIIENAMKIAKKEIIIMDIASSYKPKDIMLSGEPYLLDYLKDIDNTLSCFEKTNFIDNHVDIWRYKQ